MKPKLVVFSVFLFLLTIFLRIYQIEDKFSFSAEYNYKLWPVKEILYDHKIRLIGIEAVSYLHHIHYPPLALYIFSLPLMMSGGNPLSIEISLIILSGVTSLLLFYFGTKFHSKLVGAFSGLIYSTSFFMQRTDRFIWVVGTIIFFTSLFLILMLKITRANKNRTRHLLIFSLGLIIGLALNFHFQAIALLIVGLLFLYLRFKKQKVYVKYLLFLAGLLLPLVPLIIFELRHNFYNSRGILLLVKDSQGIISSSGPSIFSRGLQALSEIFLDIIYYPLNYQSVIIAFLLNFTALLVLIKKLNSSDKNDMPVALSLIGLWIFGIISFPLVQNRYYKTDYYLFYLMPISIFIISFLLEKLLFLAKRRYYLIAPIIIAFLLFNINRSITFQPDVSWSSQKQAVEYILNNAPADNFNIKFQGTNSEAFDYLFYYFSKKYNINYKNIHYVEKWNNEKNIKFMLSSEELDNYTQNFGNIYVKKIAD